MGKRDSLPAGLERVFSEGHQYFDRVFWDVAVGQYWDRFGDVYLELDDLPRFGLAAREASPQALASPAGWDVDTVTKHGKRCIRYCKTVNGRDYVIEQSSNAPSLFTAFRWSNVVGMVWVASGSADECARRSRVDAGEVEPSKPVKVGDRVSVLGGIRFSKVVEVRSGSTGQPLYVLADGGWMSANEIEPV